MKLVLYPTIPLIAVAVQLSAQKPTVATKQTVQTGWKVTTDKSPMDDSPIVTLALEAKAGIRGWLTKAKPVLILRCREHETSALVYTGMPAQPTGDLYEHDIRYRIDDAPPVSENWSESTSDNALFAAKPNALIKDLLKAGRLRFEFTPFHSNAVVAEFDVSGLAQHIRSLRQACPDDAPDTAADVAPDRGRVAVSTPSGEDQVYFEFQVEKQVTALPGNQPPAYPLMLRSANVEGEVLAQFVVDTLGRADVTSFKVLKTTHDLFTSAVKSALPNMRFTPAEVGGRKVKQLVQMPFDFSLGGRANEARLATYAPTAIELFIPPLPFPPKLRGFRLVADFDVDENGTVLSFKFGTTGDGAYDTRLNDALKTVRFRPATTANGTPVKGKARIVYDF